MNAYTIRIAQRNDERALLRLAALDSRRPPRGTTLVAETASGLVAAMAMSGDAIADPFQPTAEAVELLRLRLRHHRELSGFVPGRRAFFRTVRRAAA